ncbi:HAD family hydrolase [Enterococcus faecalis]
MKAIVFDVDDTLYDQQQPFRNAIEQVFPQVTATDLHQLYIRFRHHSDERFPQVMSGDWSLEFMRYFRINESLKDLGYEEVHQKTALFFQEVYEKELDNIVMHPEIKKLLDRLKACQIPMGIITNGPTDHQSRKVKQLQLENWIPSERIIISQSTGYQKPEKEIFHLASQQFQMNPEETLYVGDSFENDVVGARNGGWHALWFNHRLRALPANETAFYQAEVTCFTHLTSTIEALLQLSVGALEK